MASRALCQEYTRRYEKVHALEKAIRELAMRGPQTGDLEPFVLVMPEEYKTTSTDPVMCYRKFLVAEKTRYATCAKLVAQSQGTYLDQE